VSARRIAAVPEKPADHTVAALDTPAARTAVELVGPAAHTAAADAPTVRAPVDSKRRLSESAPKHRPRGSWAERTRTTAPAERYPGRSAVERAVRERPAARRGSAAGSALPRMPAQRPAGSGLRCMQELEAGSSSALPHPPARVERSDRHPVPVLTESVPRAPVAAQREASPEEEAGVAQAGSPEAVGLTKFSPVAEARSREVPAWRALASRITPYPDGSGCRLNAVAAARTAPSPSRTATTCCSTDRVATKCCPRSP
jgi:hypothetical protein